MAVHQHIAHGEILREAHDGIVYRSVAVRMVTAENLTDGVCALAVSLVRPEIVFMIGIEDPPVDGL